MPTRQAGPSRSIPGSSLTDQAVTVSWSGFTPTTPEGLHQVIIVQCTEDPSSLADCFTEAPFPSSADGNQVVNGVTRADGTGSVRFEVRPAAQLPSLGCNQEQRVHDPRLREPGRPRRRPPDPVRDGVGDVREVDC